MLRKNPQPTSRCNQLSTPNGYVRSKRDLDFAATKQTPKGALRTTPLRVKPVKLRDSLYLLIPVDIARLVGVVSSSDFHLRLDEDNETVRLVYEMKKETEDQPERKQEASKL